MSLRRERAATRTRSRAFCLACGLERVPKARDRTLRIEGLRNARDLGGLRRRTGLTTPKGVFFRSENLDRIQPAGWDQVWTAGIRTVVDLRQPCERAGDASCRPSWVTTVAVDLDGLENKRFWKGYWDNGLVGTALYFLPHLEAMSERAALLSAIVTAHPGGVLFHCMGGRDRTGMVALLLLTAANAEREEIVDDYMETVRLGEVRAAASRGNNAEPAMQAICRAQGTSTKGAVRRGPRGFAPGRGPRKRGDEPRSQEGPDDLEGKHLRS